MRSQERFLNVGDIIILNGTSSSGKTSIAREMQLLSYEPLLHSGVDHFLHNMPRRVFDDSTWCTMARDAQGLVLWVTLGPKARTFFHAVYRAVAGFAQAGISVILEDVMHDEEIVQYAVGMLAGFNPLLVGIQCRIEVALERERRRGDRALGGAAAFFESAHRFTEYDLEIDTSDVSARQAATAVLVARDMPRAAMHRLHDRFQIKHRS